MRARTRTHAHAHAHASAHTHTHTHTHVRTCARAHMYALKARPEGEHKESVSLRGNLLTHGTRLEKLWGFVPVPPDGVRLEEPQLQRLRRSPFVLPVPSAVQG